VSTIEGLSFDGNNAKIFAARLLAQYWMLLPLQEV